MKLGVVSDIHGNWPALEAVNSEISDEISGYLMLGDFIGILGFQKEVIDFAMNNSIMAIKGNHDISVLEHNRGLVNSKALSKFELGTANNQLTEEQKKWIINLQSYKEFDNIVMSHSYPSPEYSDGLSRPYRQGLKKGSYTEVCSHFDDNQFDFILTGHTHTQAKLDCSKFGHQITVANPGSVGQPIEKQQAEYAVIDQKNKSIDLRSTRYDNSSVVNHLNRLSVPIRWWR